MTTLALIRHGQTDWNLQGLLQGSSDTPLNATGRGQAQDAVAVLRDAGVAWSVVVSSPLARARVTAEIVAEELGVPLGGTYDELIERDYGVLEGVTESEVERLWPGKSEPSVETLDSVVERGHRALARIGADHPGQDVIVVCHGTIIRYTLSDIVGYKVDTIENATVSLVEIGDDARSADRPSAATVLTVNGAAVEVAS
ncbi:histidine phosphatase family protein [Schumannella sp. 10F1B-5-1]|uniref:histidine phosphatase family protein n=1 Tax=Schumannella sp. 10F1B-5-1 TaxID=2590780 RepID=UPI001130FC71|nr:histidine phosphatase family protein [Schumannella sp. 10F1B-5-1]TPW72318.1 histidine phosphatase family protein [Schumannella sp. 10F1B-5-1]